MNISKENMRRISDLVESGSTITLEDINDLHGHNELLTLRLEARRRLMLGVEIERDKLKAENERLQGMLAEWDRSPHGKIVLQNLELRKSLAECAASLEGEVLQKFHGQKPEDMHPVTRREYDRDMAEIEGYKALSKEG